MRILLLSILVLMMGNSLAQEVLGYVTDTKKEPIANASVQLKQCGILKGGTITDFDGRYSVKPLDAGYYDLTVTYCGFQTRTYTKAVVITGEKTCINFTLEQADAPPREVIVVYKKPMMACGHLGASLITPREDKVERRPSPFITDLKGIKHVYFEHYINSVLRGNFNQIDDYLTYPIKH